MIRYCWLVFLYWLSNCAHEWHIWLYRKASKEVRATRASAFRYNSLEYTQETINLVKEHANDLSGTFTECNRLLGEESQALWRLEEQLAEKAKQGTV